MSEHLAAATRRRAETTRARAHQALRRLDHDGAPITYTAVARAAGVSRALLYRDPELRETIDKLRQHAHLRSTSAGRRTHVTSLPQRAPGQPAQRDQDAARREPCPPGTARREPRRTPGQHMKPSVSDMSPTRNFDNAATGTVPAPDNDQRPHRAPPPPGPRLQEQVQPQTPDAPHRRRAQPMTPTAAGKSQQWPARASGSCARAEGMPRYLQRGATRAAGTGKPYS